MPPVQDYKLDAHFDIMNKALVRLFEGPAQASGVVNKGIHIW
jgi:hypothetical protein